MATVLDLCVDAMREIGACALEEQPTPAEAQTVLRKLNLMRESWNTQSLLIYAVTKETFPIVASQASYTMGPGGNFNTTRPIKIVDVKTQDDQGNIYPVEMINYDDYAAILPPYIESPLAQVIYNDNKFPLLTLYPWPIWNNSSYSAVIWSWQAISNFASLTQVIALPPGYERALVYNLAVECGPSFGRPITQDLRDLATTSKADLKRLNEDVLQMGFDSALLKRQSGWNWQAQCFGGIS